MIFEIRIPPIHVEVTPTASPNLGLVVGPVRNRSLPLLQEETLMATFALTDTQEVRAAISPLDPAKNPAQIDGVATWESSDPKVLTVTPVDKTGLVVTISTVGNLGSATVSVTADADLGDGVRSITETMDFEVSAGEASSLNPSIGTPTERVNV